MGLETARPCDSNVGFMTEYPRISEVFAGIDFSINRMSIAKGIPKGMVSQLPMVYYMDFSEKDS